MKHLLIAGISAFSIALTSSTAFADTPSTEIMLGLRGTPALLATGGALAWGQIEAVGGVALGGNHAFIAVGRLGGTANGGIFTAGASLGYRGYFGSGTLQPGVAVTFDPEVWIKNGGALVLGPAIMPILKFHQFSVSLPVTFTFAFVGDGRAGGAFGVRPGLQLGVSF